MCTQHKVTPQTAVIAEPRKYKYAVTHGGQAHRDDMVCMMLLGGLDLVDEVYRRNPTEDELNDPEIIVFDTGNRHEPELGNFDHHQLGKDAEPDCAAWMIARYLGYHEDMMEMFAWYKMLALLDAKGPFAVANSVHCRWEDICGLMGPMEEFFLKLMSAQDVGYIGKCEGHDEDNPGVWLIAQIEGYRGFIRRAEEQVTVADVNGVQGLMAESLSPVDAGRYLALYRLRLQKQNPGTVYGWCITADDRGPGLTLYRYGDDKRVNFSGLATHPGITFAHPGGFIAKTADKNLIFAKNMVLLSVASA